MYLAVYAAAIVFAPGDITVADAFGVLAQQYPSEAQVYEAVQVIDGAYADGDPECIRRLVDVWSSGEPGQGHIAKELAFKKADDKTLPIILEGARRILDRQEARGEKRSNVFAVGADELCKHLQDPEPLVRFIFEETVGRSWEYAPTQALKDKYLLMDVRRWTDACDGGAWAGAWGGAGTPSLLAQNISDAAAPKLRDVMRELRSANPTAVGIAPAVHALVYLSDGEIIPDLEALLADSPPAWLEHRLRSYLVKLRYQHDAPALLGIVETERESPEVLTYAVWRLLWLGHDPQAIREALRKNRFPSAYRGIDIAENLTYYLFGEGPDYVEDPKHGKTRRFRIDDSQMVDPLILDHDEYRQYLRDSTAASQVSRRLQARINEIQQAGSRTRTWTDQDAAKVEELQQEIRDALYSGNMAKYKLVAILNAAFHGGTSYRPSGPPLRSGTIEPRSNE
jgi:hypothetical protein